MSKELINISLHSSGGGLDIPFKAGTISIPDTPGAYAISSGCGSGKTESIKSLIRLKHDDGILYAVDTIQECIMMYDWIKEELVKPGIITDGDVMMIHSLAPLESYKKYLDHPEQITKVKVLIVVQVRFFVELINYFLLYNPTSSPKPFDGNFKTLMSRNDIRRYIVFDESPLFLKPFVSLTKGELACYATKTSKGWKCKSLADVRDIYTSFIKGDKKMDYNHGDSKLSLIKNEVVVSAIPQKFGEWMLKTDGKCTIQYYPADLVQQGMTSYVLIYEGAGDILIGKGSRFKLLDLPLKYNANVHFHQFSFGLSRKKSPDALEYASFVKTVLSILQCSPGKTLIVVWRDFKGTGITETGTSVNVDRLRDALQKAKITDDSYSITYYGASDTKSTNQYRDYTNVILCGRWGLGGSVIEKLKLAFDCQTPCMENFMMWYYVQLLCRTGIRNNNGGTYHVYYSSDHTDTFINRLSVYFNQNIFIPQKIKSNVPLWNVIVRQYIKRGQGYLIDIHKLILRDPGLKDAIERHTPYTYTISLKDIASLCYRKKRAQKDNYKALIAFLRNFGVDLVITTK